MNRAQEVVVWIAGFVALLFVTGYLVDHFKANWANAMPVIYCFVAVFVLFRTKRGNSN